MGDALKVKATLTSPAEDFEQAFWVRIRDPKKPPKKRPKPEDDNKSLGLPDYKLLAKEPKQEGWWSWDQADEAGAEMGYDVVMHPYVVDGDTLKTILINMDSKVWMNFRSSLGSSPTEGQLQVALVMRN